MKCGRERPQEAGAAASATPAAVSATPSVPPAAPPSVPPAAPPLPPPPSSPAPPAYAPQGGYAQPGPGALFLRRTFTGDWLGSAKAVLWPTALLLVLALAVSLPSSDDYEEADFAHWSDRFQVVIAVLMQGLGGTFEVETRRGGSLITMFVQGGGSLSVWLLTFTLAWAGAVALGARLLRRSRPQGAGGGAEAALRIGLLSGAVVLVLGLYGQPDVKLFTVDTSPVLAALFTFALSGAVSASVLCREELLARSGAGALMAVRAWGTALRALGLTVALCAVVVFVVVASHESDVSGWGVLASLLVLVNLALMALGLSWGASVEASAAKGRGGEEGGTFGLSQLGDTYGGWAQTGALALGVVCAVILALLLARRSADRREQILSGAFFLGAFWLLSLVSGAEMEMSAGTSFGYGSQSGGGRMGPNVGESLLFGLLWTAGAVLLAAFLTRTGRTTPGVPPGYPAPPVAWPAPAAPTAPAAPAAPAAPTGPPAAPAQPPVAPAVSAAPAAPAARPAPEVPTAVTDVTPAPVAPAATPPRRTGRSRIFMWVAVGLAAFVVGGAAAGGVLLMNKKNDEKSGGGTAQANKPAASPAEGAKASGGPATAQPPASPSTSPSTSPSMSPSTSPSSPAPFHDGPVPEKDLPSGYSTTIAPEGFSVVLPDGWHRMDKGSGQIDFVGSTGFRHLRVGIARDLGKSAHDHFLELEKVVSRQDGYQRVQLTANRFQGKPGALWEWTYKEKGSGRLVRSIDQAYIDDTGTEYAIQYEDYDENWTATRTVFDNAVRYWRVAPLDID
ncbi:type VII secretion-associated protein,c family [Streptomyces netropsis]|nr:type VII secretion-associated protein,c family [Streptomyces netropsis]